MRTETDKSPMFNSL